MSGRVREIAPHSRTVVLLALLVLAATQTPYVFLFHNPALDGGLFGPDSYMRVHRVQQLYETGDWYDAFDTRTNAPFGERIHWTRPLDAMLIAGAWIGSAVAEFRDALRVWATALSPLLLVATVLVLSWGTRGMIGSGAFLFMVALIALMPVFNGTFLLARPDHHGLQVFLFTAQLMIFLRLALGTAPARLAVLAGAVAGFGLWVSVEAILPAGCFGAWLVAIWLWRSGEQAHHVALYGAGMLLAVTLALPLERPWAEISAAHYERLSVVHVVLVLSAALAWLTIDGATRPLGLEGSRRRRFLAASAGALVPIAVMAAFYPKFFGGPFVDYDAAEFYPWLEKISEYQPLLPHDRRTTVSFLVQLGPAAIAIGYLVWRWPRALARERDMLALFGLGLAAFLPLALGAARWASYVQGFALIPWVLAARAAILADPQLAVGARRIKLRPATVIVVAVGHLIAAAVIAPADVIAAPKERACDFPAVSRHLARAHRGGVGDDVLFTYLFVGPQMIWRTPYSVIGAPYGNGAALRDTRALFTATADETAMLLVERRGIDLILICRNDRENALYRDPAHRTLFSRLEDGHPPDWLHPVPLPDEVAGEFSLYRVEAEDGRVVRSGPRRTP